MYSLYQLRFPNGKRYIGISKNVQRRLREHRCAAEAGESLPLHKAIRHYGWSSVVPSVLVIGKRDYIAELECRAIEAFRTLCNDGYNVSLGGDLSPMLSVRTRKKQSATLKGYVPTAEARANMSKAQRGRKHSEATKEKIRAANKGRIVSDQTRERLRLRTPPTTSAETRYKMSESHLALFRDPEYKARHTEAVRAAVERKRNKS